MEVPRHAEGARLAHVSRARITQIMNLLHLAPDIPEAILHLPRATGGHDPLAEHVIALAHCVQLDAPKDYASSRPVRPSAAPS